MENFWISFYLKMFYLKSS